MIKNLILIPLILLLGLSPVLANNGLDTIKSVQQAIDSKNIDLVQDKLNESKQYIDQGVLIEYLYRLWTGEEDDNGMMQYNKVKIEVVDVLTQAVSNDLYEIDVADFLTFSREMLNQNDLVVKSDAILVIGRIGSANDLDVLREIAVGNPKSESVFRSSVSALLLRCSFDNEGLITELKLVVTREKRLDFIDGLEQEKFSSRFCMN